MMRNPKIMIVEDEAIVAMAMEQKFIKNGYDVCEIIDSGEVAIEKAKETMPDLILMDILLKGKINGLEAAREIRAFKDIPILFMTGYESKRTMQKVKDFKPVASFTKPVIWEHLKASVDYVIQKNDRSKPVDIKKSLSILVVDDEEEVCNILNKFLTRNGHKVKAVVSGAEAIGLLKTAEYDLVLTDIDMPNVTGHDVLKVANELAKRPKTGIITGSIEMLKPSEGSLSVDFILRKPFKLPELAKHINDLFCADGK